jgi:hypothetical protein
MNFLNSQCVSYRTANFDFQLGESGRVQVHASEALLTLTVRPHTIRLPEPQQHDAVRLDPRKIRYSAPFRAQIINFSGNFRQWDTVLPTKRLPARINKCEDEQSDESSAARRIDRS